jgi:putative zinc finger/helix-turn-helix YgiT family protein
MSDSIEYLPEGTCPSCYEGQLEESRRDFVSRISDGRQVEVKDLVAQTCNKCGKSIFPRESLDLIDAALVQSIGALTPEQIQHFVEATGLREDELCDTLGFGAKTIYRWRRGAQRPSKSLSILLGIVAHHPNLIEWIEREEWRKTPAGHSSDSPVGISYTHGVRRSRSEFSIETPRTSRRIDLASTHRAPRIAEKSNVFIGATDNPIHQFYALAGSSYARN